MIALTCVAVGLVAWRGISLLQPPPHISPIPLGEPLAAWKPPAVLTIWPENSANPASANYRESQAKVDAGGSQWRLDPVRTAIAFVHAVLGDIRVTLRPELLYGPQAGRSIILRLNCTCAQAEHNIVVFVTQPGRKGRRGIWSVVSVTSPSLAVPTPFGNPTKNDALAGLGPFPIRIDQTPSEHAAVGISSYDGCRSDYAGAVDLKGSQTFQLDLHGGARLGPSVGPQGQSCSPVRAAYVFAYTTPRLTTQVGDPLKESAAITDLSITAVYWEPGTNAGP